MTWLKPTHKKLRSTTGGTGPNAWSKRLRTMGELYKENGEAERAGLANEWAKKLKENCMTPVTEARKGLKTDEQKATVKRWKRQRFSTLR